MKNPFQDYTYKNGIEGFLSMYLKKYQFVLGSDLESYSKSNELLSKDIPCNIYFVLKRPKVTIAPDSIKSKNKKIDFDFIIHNNDQKSVISLGIELKEAKSNLEIETKYPYNLFVVRDSERIHLVARPSSLIDSYIVNNNISESILDYEILYIGQSFGKNGKRTALNRLVSHETVQKIYTHALTENPDCDIWFLLTHFSQVNMLFSLPQDIIDENKKNIERDEKLVNHFIDNKGFEFSERQRINFTEAGLIRMFEPKYNDKFKNSFPLKNHISYSECYNLDIRALNIELDTSEMVRKIFTKKTGRKKYHSKMFEFENTDDRIKLFE